MTTPEIGSRWIDIKAKNPTPHAIGRNRHPAQRGVTVPGEWRRTVKVVAVDGISATIHGFWQVKEGDGWRTIARRVCSADTASFGRRFQPLEEQ